MYPKQKKKLEETAKKRIKTLFKQASEEFKEHPELSDRYVRLARKIGQQARISIPEPYKHRYCKKCESFWVVGKTLRKRTREGKIVYTCQKCGNIRRKPYIREQKAKRKEKHY